MRVGDGFDGMGCQPRKEVRTGPKITPGAGCGNEILNGAELEEYKLHVALTARLNAIDECRRHGHVRPDGMIGDAGIGGKEGRGRSIALASFTPGCRGVFLPATPEQEES